MVKVEKFDERAIFVNDGRTVIPMSDSAAAKTATIAGKPAKIPVKNYLAELPVGTPIASPYINQIRFGMRGDEGLSSQI